MSETANTMYSTLGCLHALDVDIVLEQIFVHLKSTNDNILNYRSVCHKWNDIIVQIFNKSGQSFKIPLRYGPQVPQFIVESNAACLAEEVLKNTIGVLTGTAGRLVFDTIVIDRDFFLGRVTSEWTTFLEIQGKFIRHLQLNIRSGESPESFENHVMDCEEVVSVENLRAIFFYTLNLESLNFCVGFSNYLAQRAGQVNFTNFNLFPNGDIPQLYKLISVTIQEPLEFHYTGDFIKEILSMAPNLTVLNIEPRNYLSEFTSAMKSLEPQLKRSLTSLGFRNVNIDVDSADVHLNGLTDISFLQLTKLELNNIFGDGRTVWLNALLQAQHSTLVTLILGEKNNGTNGRWFPKILDSSKLLVFPPVMEKLKRLEVNLSKLKHLCIRTYKDTFPVLEFLSFTCWQRGHEYSEMIHLAKLLPGVSGHSQTVKDFLLIGPIRIENRERIVKRAHDTFPMAECHFDS